MVEPDIQKEIDFEASLTTRRDKSALIAINVGMANCSPRTSRTSSVRTHEKFEPRCQLDRLSSIEAIVSTFRAWPFSLDKSSWKFNEDMAINQEEAFNRIQSIDNINIKTLADRFIRELAQRSLVSGQPVDLGYHARLFLIMVQNDEDIDNIISGKISDHSIFISDYNNW